MEALSSRLVPYFATNHPARGDIPGPFTKLHSSPLRRLVLDLIITAFHTTGVNDQLKAAVQLALTDTNELRYWIGLTSPTMCRIGAC